MPGHGPAISWFGSDVGVNHSGYYYARLPESQMQAKAGWPFKIRYKTRDNAMRNRKKQQELIKAKVIREEKLELHDSYGKKDPTPYEAVKNMIRRGKTTADCRMKRVAARRT